MGKSDKDDRKRAKKMRKKARRESGAAARGDVDGKGLPVVDFEKEEERGQRRVRPKRTLARKLRGLCYKDPLSMVQPGDEEFSQDEYEGVEGAKEDYAYPRAPKQEGPAKRKRGDDEGGDEGDEGEGPAAQRAKRRSGGRTKAPRDGAKLSTQVALPEPSAMKREAARGEVDAGARARLSEACGEEVAACMAEEGYGEPTEVQRSCWPPALSGRDVLGVAPPGSGKTLAFVLPCAARAVREWGQGPGTRPAGPLCLVLAPTRELAQQEVAAWRGPRKALGLRALGLFGGAPRDAQVDALARQDPHTVVGTPGRVLDLARAGDLELKGVRVVVVDEADRMLREGMGEQLEELRGMILGAWDGQAGGKRGRGQGGKGVGCVGGRPQAMLFSATMPDDVAAVCKRWLRDPVRVTASVDGSLLSASVTQVVHVCAEHKKPRKLTRHLERIMEQHKGDRVRPRVLVFANRVKTVRFLVKELTRAGYKVVSLHGSRSQSEREAAMGDFRSGKAQVMVATDVAARGLHIRGLPYLVNYDCPSNLEQYIRRVGRTGRLSATGHAFTFLTRALARLSPAILKLLRDHNQSVDPNLEALATAWEEMSARLTGEQLRVLEERQQEQEDAEADRVAGEGGGAREEGQAGEGVLVDEGAAEEGRRRVAGDMLLVPDGPRGRGGKGGEERGGGGGEAEGGRGEGGWDGKGRAQGGKRLPGRLRKKLAKEKAQGGAGARTHVSE